jgi:hypothetical protein
MKMCLEVEKVFEWRTREMVSRNFDSDTQHKRDDEKQLYLPFL